MSRTLTPGMRDELPPIDVAEGELARLLRVRGVRRTEAAQLAEQARALLHEDAAGRVWARQDGAELPADAGGLERLADAIVGRTGWGEGDLCTSAGRS